MHAVGEEGPVVRVVRAVLMDENGARDSFCWKGNISVGW